MVLKNVSQLLQINLNDYLKIEIRQPDFYSNLSTKSNSEYLKTVCLDSLEMINLKPQSTLSVVWNGATWDNSIRKEFICLEWPGTNSPNPKS